MLAETTPRSRLPIPDWLRGYQKARLRSISSPVDGGGHRETDGDSLLDDCRVAGAGRPLHGVSADGDLRDARDVTLLEREYDDDLSFFRRPWNERRRAETPRPSSPRARR
jgi:hypothetical protein